MAIYGTAVSRLPVLKAVSLKIIRTYCALRLLSNVTDEWASQSSRPCLFERKLVRNRVSDSIRCLMSVE